MLWKVGRKNITSRPRPTRGSFAALCGSVRGRAARLKRYAIMNKSVHTLNGI